MKGRNGVREHGNPLSHAGENPLINNVLLSELQTISVGSNGEAMVVCEPRPHCNKRSNNI